MWASTAGFWGRLRVGQNEARFAISYETYYRPTGRKVRRKKKRVWQK